MPRPDLEVVRNRGIQSLWQLLLPRSNPFRPLLLNTTSRGSSYFPLPHPASNSLVRAAIHAVQRKSEKLPQNQSECDYARNLKAPLVLGVQFAGLPFGVKSQKSFLIPTLLGVSLFAQTRDSHHQSRGPRKHRAHPFITSKTDRSLTLQVGALFGVIKVANRALARRRLDDTGRVVE